MLHLLIQGGTLACTFLLIANAVQLWKSSCRVRRRLSDLEKFSRTERIRQQRLIELSRLNAAHQFEVRWLTALSAPHPLPQQIFSLLEEYAETPHLEAWFVNSAGEVLSGNDPSRKFTRILTFSHQGLGRLHSRRPPRKLFLQQDYFLIPGETRLQHTCFSIFPCNESPRGRAYLCLTGSLSVTGDPAIDHALLGRLCHQISSAILNDNNDNSERSSTLLNEFDLIRDMLTLRTLTDEEYESPRIMLEEFLSRLAELTGFQRASVYQIEHTPLKTLELLASGGMSVSPQDDLAWLNHELDWLQESTTGAERVIWKTEEQGYHSPTRFSLTSGLIIHDLPEDRNHRNERTCLVLSSRQETPHSDLKIELAKWSAQFLPQTFRKAMSRLQTEERARRDSLTRLANRQTFDSELSRAWSYCNSQQLPCSLLLMDLDHFKSINDQHGHPVGDAVLQSAAATISRIVDQMRVADRLLAARYGGEEFVILLPEIPLAGAERIAEQIRQAIELQGHPLHEGRLHFTTSIGVACSGLHGETPAELIQAADKALYAAKHRGRNTVCTAETRTTVTEERVPLSVTGRESR